LELELKKIYLDLVSASRFRSLATVFVASCLTACGVGSSVYPNALAIATQESTSDKPLITSNDSQAPIVTADSSAKNLDSKSVARWSDASFWGGQKPIAGSNVLIPAGTVLILDESPPNLNSLTIDGELRFSDSKTIALQAGYIVVAGSLLLGTTDAPLRNSVSITLTGTKNSADALGMGTRGIFVNGGKLEMFGITPQPNVVSLGDHAAAGTKSLTLSAQVNWQSGDPIVVSPTDYFGISSTEKHTISSNNGDSIAIAQPLSANRWGRLQYVTPSGMSLVKDTRFVPRFAGTPTMLDERAVIANLRRNIVIQSVNDTDWSRDGFGAQVMVMGASANVTIDGVELRRVGQAGTKGRYPIHFHQISYDSSTGVEIPKAGTRLIKNNAIWDSKNRCITIHGSSDVTVDRNTCYDIDGHAIFLEDAVERRNQITNNLVLKVKAPATPLIRSDIANGDTGPAGFWITNPDNVVTGNRAADTEGNGFWLAFPGSPLGINKLAKNGLSPMLPKHMKFGVFDDNISHSNKTIGIQFDLAPIDDFGTVAASTYSPTSDEGPDRFEQNRLRFTLARNVIFKNRRMGLWNRVTWPTYEKWTAADNEGLAFSGAGSDGVIQRSLVIGKSLNNANTWQNLPGLAQPIAFATYHSTFQIKENLAVSFDYVTGKPSGVFNTEDYYLVGVDKGPVRNMNNQLVNAFPGYRMPVRTSENWTLAGALWDPYGYWGRPGNYWTYNNPFLTYGADCQSVPFPNGDLPNSMSCATEYYGVDNFWTETSQLYLPKMPLKVSRLDSAGNTVGLWTVGDGNFARILSNMRHFAAMRGGRYQLEFVGLNAGDIPLVPAEFLQMQITNAFRPEDEFILGVPFSSATIPKIKFENRKATMQLTAVASLAMVEASNGNVFWQDRNANRIWIKAKTPNGEQDANSSELSDANLYRGYYLRIDK
jgi:G8 domain/Right handed beta helix region